MKLFFTRAILILTLFFTTSHTIKAERLPGTTGTKTLDTNEVTNKANHDWRNKLRLSALMHSKIYLTDCENNIAQLDPNDQGSNREIIENPAATRLRQEIYFFEGLKKMLQTLRKFEQETFVSDIKDYKILPPRKKYEVSPQNLIIGLIKKTQVSYGKKYGATEVQDELIKIATARIAELTADLQKIHEAEAAAIVAGIVIMVSIGIVCLVIKLIVDQLIKIPQGRSFDPPARAFAR